MVEMFAMVKTGGPEDGMINLHVLGGKASSSQSASSCLGFPGSDRPSLPFLFWAREGSNLLKSTEKRWYHHVPTYSNLSTGGPSCRIDNPQAYPIIPRFPLLGHLMFERRLLRPRWPKRRRSERFGVSRPEEGIILVERRVLFVCVFFVASFFWCFIFVVCVVCVCVWFVCVCAGVCVCVF